MRTPARPRLVLASLVLLATTVYCGTLPGPGIDNPLNASYLLTTESLAGSPNILSAMRGRIGNLQIQHTDRCPVIRLRGHHRLQGRSDPLVYVDGAATTDTCALIHLSVRDIDRVEVYSDGRTRRTAYRPHPHGLILVFTRGGRQ